MDIPLSWLKEFVNLDGLEPERIAARLTEAGIEADSMRYIGLPQTQVDGIRQPKSDHLVWDRDKLLYAAIREVKPHPDADRLVLAMVDYGGPELEQCVTGAPNLYDYKGQGLLDKPVWTGFAMEGAEVWDGHSDTPKRMILKGKPLRGIFNKSMVCSAKELGMSDEHEGIILIEDDLGYAPGTPLQDVLGDVVFTIELTPNLGHNFSVLGVARELAALFNRELKEPSYNVVMEGAPLMGQIGIEIHTPELNPRFTLTLLRDTEVRPSPFWMQHRLRLSGQRPINNIVDVTNYVTFEIGQPLHAYDYDLLLSRAGGKTPHIVTRLPEVGEIMTTLDGVKRTLGDKQILVADAEGPLGLGGIMGGADTEIRPETKNVLLEAASWNFINVRKTAQAQKVFTEAGTRFSRNIHPSRAPLGNKRGIELMRQLGGGTIAQGMIDEYPLVAEPITIDLPVSEIERLLGITLKPQEAADTLRRLLFEVTINGETLHVVAPDYRTDIGTGVVGQADLIEEIARVIGYDAIPTTMIADMMPDQLPDHVFQAEEKIRDLLVTLGLTENISHRMSAPEIENLLVPPGMASSLPQAGYITLANPIAPDKSVMRHTVLVGLLNNALNNLRYTNRLALFEIGSVYLKGEARLPDEPLRLGIVLCGTRRPSSWIADESNKSVDFYDLKGMIETLVGGLHLPNVTYARSTHTSFHPGRSAALVVNGKTLGDFGELHPLVVQAFKLDAAMYAAEIDLQALIAAIPVRFIVKSLPVTPAILEDVAFVVAEDIPAANVEAAIRKAGGALLKSVTLFDVYQGAPIAAGHKSLAYALTYQTDEKTLTDDEVKKLRKKIIALAERECGATLRA